MAARFPDRERATAALQSIKQELDNGLEVDIAPLADDGRDHNSMLLAGHFDENVAPEVASIVQASGGEIVADVDERWTVPRHGSTR